MFQTCSIFTSLKLFCRVSSDHSPVIATISTTIIKIPSKPSFYNQQTNWNKKELNNEELQISINLKIPQEIDEATEVFITTVQNCAWAATPTITNKIRNDINILEMDRGKRRVRTRWQQSRNPADKNSSTQISKFPIRKSNTEWARTDQEKADTFAQYFTQVFTPRPHSNTPDTEVEEFLDIPN